MVCFGGESTWRQVWFFTCSYELAFYSLSRNTTIIYYPHSNEVEKKILSLETSETITFVLLLFFKIRRVMHNDINIKQPKTKTNQKVIRDG